MPSNTKTQGQGIGCLGVMALLALLAALFPSSRQSTSNNDDKSDTFIFLPQTQKSYFNIIDSFDKKIKMNARSHDSNNPLQMEEYERLDKSLHYDYKAIMNKFFSSHTRIDEWQARLQSIDANNTYVTLTFRSNCKDTDLITVIPRNEPDLMALIRDMKTYSNYMVVGSVRQIGHWPSSNISDQGAPLYIAFVTNGLAAINTDHTTTQITKSLQQASPALYSAIDSAASNRTKEAQRFHEKLEAERFERALRSLR